MILIVYIGIFIINKILEYGKVRYPNFEGKLINILTLISLVVFILVNLGLINYSSKIVYFSLFTAYAIFGYYLSNLDLEKLNIKEFKLNSKYIIGITFILSVLGYLLFVRGIVLNSMAAGKYLEANYFQFIVMVFTFSIFLFF